MLHVEYTSLPLGRSSATAVSIRVRWYAAAPSKSASLSCRSATDKRTPHAGTSACWGRGSAGREAARCDVVATPMCVGVQTCAACSQARVLRRASAAMCGTNELTSTTVRRPHRKPGSHGRGGGAGPTSCVRRGRSPSPVHGASSMMYSNDSGAHPRQGGSQAAGGGIETTCGHVSAGGVLDRRCNSPRAAATAAKIPRKHAAAVDSTKCLSICHACLLLGGGMLSKRSWEQPVTSV